MKLAYCLIVVVVLIASSESAIVCTIKDVKSDGIGCEIKKVTINSQPETVELSRFSPQKKAADMKWIKIADAKIVRSPKQLLDTFPNATRVTIENIQGWKTLDTLIFSKKIEKIAIRRTSLESIGEKAFSGLSRLTHLDLSGNSIKTIHKAAFSTLSSLIQIDLNSNKIKMLDNDIFENNLSLLNISLASNEIESMNAELLASNIALQRIDLGHNKISQIEEGFASNLAELELLDLSSNVCVDELLTGDNVFDLMSPLANCFAHYAYYNQASETE